MTTEEDSLTLAQKNNDLIIKSIEKSKKQLLSVKQVYDGEYYLEFFYKRVFVFHYVCDKIGLLFRSEDRVWEFTERSRNSETRRALTQRFNKAKKGAGMAVEERIRGQKNGRNLQVLVIFIVRLFVFEYYIRIIRKLSRKPTTFCGKSSCWP